MTNRRKKARVAEVRETTRRITSASDLYGGGVTGRLLAADILSNPKLGQKVEAKLQARHQKLQGRIGEDGYYRQGKHSWKVPLGVRLCVKRPMMYAQVVNQYPWYVTWMSPSGKRKRKRHATALGGIAFIATKAQYVDKHAALISRQVGYDIPTELVGKLPRPWKWCPYCMTARRFRRRSDGRTFHAERKEWSEEKQKYVWKERLLQILECKYCHMTNQDQRWRRSNQPWEVRHIKRGVRRVSPRRRRRRR
jgi:hypothetical protein